MTIIATALFSIQRLYASSENDVIIIRPGNEVETPRPGRTTIPLEAYYDSFSATIVISFISDIGNVEISVSNMNTGEYLNDSINAFLAPAFVPVSGDEGVYSITFVLSTGEAYYGEFEV